MSFLEEVILGVKLEDWKRSFEELRIEVFVINEKVEKLSIFKFRNYGVFLSE